MQRLKTLIILLLGMLATLPAQAQEDWTKLFSNASNNAVMNINAQVQDFTAAPTWTTSGQQNLVASGGMTVCAGTCYVAAQTGGDTWGNLADDRFTVKAFNAETGALYWESPALDAGRSVDLWSISTPTVDPATGFLYIASGATLQKLDPKTGAVLASVKFDASNTASGLTYYDVVNSSPAIGGGFAFVETYGADTANNKQLIAVNLASMSVAWFKHEAGVGTGTPCYAEIGNNQYVFTAVAGGIACYDVKNNGNLVWTSASAATPWTMTQGIYASIVQDGGKLFVLSNSFGANGELACADAVTGDKLWKVTTAPAASVPPVVIGGKVYVAGGAWGASRLAVYNVADGAKVFASDIPLAGNSYQNQIAATTDRLYMTDGNNKLLVVDPAQLPDAGAIQSTTGGAWPDTYDGPVTVDRRGGVYVHIGTNLRAFGQTVPVELSSFTAE